MPSTNAEPKNVTKEPRVSRLRLYEDLGQAITKAMREHAGVTDEKTYQRFVAASVVSALLHQGYTFNKDGALVNLSRYEGRDDPPHTWL